MSSTNAAKRQATSTCKRYGLHAPTVPSAKPGVSLKSTLEALQHDASATNGLRVDLPRGDDVRMRKLVHRGTQRPVFKVPSLKLDRSVHCESLLEHEAALLLDADPAVAEFTEQPVRLHFQVTADAEPTSHIPDFAVLGDGRLRFIEVKFEKDVDTGVSERTDRLRNLLNKFHVGYELWTEHHVRRGHAAENALRVLRRARYPTDDARELAALERLRSAKRLRLDQLGWDETDPLNAACIARLILGGHAQIDAEVLVTGQSTVWLSAARDHAEGNR